MKHLKIASLFFSFFFLNSFSFAIKRKKFQDKMIGYLERNWSATYPELLFQAEISHSRMKMRESRNHKLHSRQLITQFSSFFKRLHQHQAAPERCPLKKLNRPTAFAQRKVSATDRESLRELAMEISLTSLGSSHTFPLPHLSTLAARRFCSFSDTISVSLSPPSLPVSLSPRAAGTAKKMRDKW